MAPSYDFPCRFIVTIANFLFSGGFVRPKENKALFLAHRVTTKITLMRAVAKYFFGKYLAIDLVKNSLFYFSGSQYRGDELELTYITIDHLKT